MIRYCKKTYRIEEIIEGIEDQRIRPVISTETVVKSALIMCLTRMGSLNALEQQKGNSFWNKWIGEEVPSADTIGRVFARIEGEAIRDGIYYIYSRLRRNKALKPFSGGMYGLVIDGHKSSASYKRCCKGCLQRKITTEKGEIVQYYHRQVTAILLSKDFQLLLDCEQQRIGEDEVEAVKRVLKRVLRRYPRAFEVVIADGLYVRVSFFDIVLESGKILLQY